VQIGSNPQLGGEATYSPVDIADVLDALAQDTFHFERPSLTRDPLLFLKEDIHNVDISVRVRYNTQRDRFGALYS